MTPLEMLTSCCAAEDRRYQLARPFLVEQHVFATDSRIILRIPALNVAEKIGPESKAPPVWSLDWRPDAYLPELLVGPDPLPVQTFTACHCVPVGKIYGTDPKPVPGCEDCDGTGTVADIVRVALRGDKNAPAGDISLRYALILRAMGASRLRRHKTSRTLYYFTAPHNAAGLLMGMRT